MKEIDYKDMKLLKKKCANFYFFQVRTLAREIAHADFTRNQAPNSSAGAINITFSRGYSNIFLVSERHENKDITGCKEKRDRTERAARRALSRALTAYVL